MKKVAIIMGSDSDLNAVKPAALMLRKLDIPFCVRIISAHRTPEAAAQFARCAARERACFCSPARRRQGARRGRASGLHTSPDAVWTTA